MTDKVRLKNWGIVEDPRCTPYQAPETRQRCLHGAVYGHSKFKDGTVITTSPIYESDGIIITTASGTIYILKNVDPEYKKFCKENNIKLDLKNPIKIKKENDSKYMMATKAIHKMGDISRDEPDLCHIYRETETDYIGSWVTGFGFFDVKFPKETTRELTQEEIEKYNKISIQISDQPSVRLKVD